VTNITEEQFRRIEGCFPVQRGNLRVSNLNVLNAILYVAQNGCKWRSLPRRYERWHTIYTRLNRWAKAGVLDRVFAALQEEEIVRIRLEAPSLDSTIVQVHPDGTGAGNETARSPSDGPESRRRVRMVRSVSHPPRRARSFSGTPSARRRTVDAARASRVRGLCQAGVPLRPRHRHVGWLRTGRARPRGRFGG
jgi:transposase